MFGEKIKELREGFGWTQEELGKRLGVSRQSVSNWENGNIMPSIDLLVSLSDLFQTSTDYILERNSTNLLDISDLDTEQQAVLLRMMRYFQEINKSPKDK